MLDLLRVGDTAAVHEFEGFGKADLLRVGDTAAIHEFEGIGKRARSVPDARPSACRGHGGTDYPVPKPPVSRALHRRKRFATHLDSMLCGGPVERPFTFVLS